MSIDFFAFVSKWKGKPVSEVASATNTPVEIVQSFITFMDYYKKQCLANGQKEPTDIQYINEWKRRHDPDNRSVTYLTINQLDDLIRKIVREELQKVG